MDMLKKLREKLDDKEKKYCDEYLKHGNKLKAYQSVFPDAESHRGNPYAYHSHQAIQNYLNALSEETMEKARLDKAWVLKRLKQNSDTGAEGWETENGHKYDLSGSNRATELIGKELGMFANQININGIDELVNNLASKADQLASQMAQEDTEED